MTETGFSLTLIIFEIGFSAMVLATLARPGIKKSLLAGMSVIFIMWLTVMYALIRHGFFSATGMPQWSFTLGVMLPAVLGYLAISISTSLRQVVAAMTTWDFLRLQYWRAAFGGMFFFTAALPIWFKFVGGLGDIAAGIGAFLALTFLGHHPKQERQAIIRGNFIGILDFVIVLSLGAGVVLRGKSPDIMFDLIPLYVVPIFILLHIFSLHRLTKTR